MNGYQVSDALWAFIKPLIPKHINRHPLGGGRKRIVEARAKECNRYREGQRLWCSRLRVFV